MRPHRFGGGLVPARASFLATALALAIAPAARAGFPGTDVFIPAVARVAGSGGAQFYSTLWVTNLSTSSSIPVEYRLLLQGQANPAPVSVRETLAPGETKRHDNVVTSLFGLESGAGAVRVVAGGKVLVSSRTYDQPPGADLRDVKGLFFGGVPASVAIGAGETAHLQGISQGGGEDYRYNFGFVEVAGQAASVRVTLRAPGGTALATKEYALAAGEARQVNVGDLLGAVATTNGRLEATVVGGSGRVLVYGTQIANGSQDSAGFEMSFKEGLLVENAAGAAEGLAAGASATVVAVTRRTLELSLVLGVAGREARAREDGSYDPATGFWTVSASLVTGQSATFQIQFRDAQGQPQRLYNPLTTASIVTRGSATGLQGHLSFDLVLTGTSLLTPDVTVNGTGTAAWQGASGTVQVNALVVPKQPGAYPKSGTVVVTSGGITVTVTFDGTSTAHGTYTFRNQTIRFTIDLATGEVIVG